MRVLAIALCAAACAACTFPAVDYYDDASDGGTTSGSTTSTGAGGGCSAPKPCNTQASSCGNTAITKRDGCLKACKQNDTTCTSACTSTYDSEVAVCESTCESCASMHGCTDASASCAALSGG